MTPFRIAAAPQLGWRWLLRIRSPITFALLGYAALAFSIFTNDGSRDLAGIILVLAAIAAWGKALAVVVLRGPAARGSETAQAPATSTDPASVEEAERTVWCVALGSALLAFVRAPGSHVRGGLGVYHLLVGAVVALLASYALDLRDRAPAKPAVIVLRRALLFLLALVLGAWMLKASPEPLIDVFPLHQQTAQALLDGKNIYEPGAVNVLDTNQHNFMIRTYVYLPLSAYLTTAAFAITHDIRWADLVSQLVGAGLLWVVAWRCAKGGAESTDPTKEDPTAPRSHLTPATWADLVAASLLFHPRGLLVLEKAWTEPLALPFLGGFIVLALARRPIAASICLGFLCALKQHLVLYVPFLMLFPGIGMTGVVIAGVVAIATLAQYLIRAPLEMYRGAFGSIANSPFRIDALSVPAELRMIGIAIPTWVGFVAALFPYASLPRVPREMGPLLLGPCLVFGLFYAFGRQAFCNYYYLLDATALFAVAALRAPTRSEVRSAPVLLVRDPLRQVSAGRT